MDKKRKRLIILAAASVLVLVGFNLFFWAIQPTFYQKLIFNLSVLFYYQAVCSPAPQTAGIGEIRHPLENEAFMAAFDEPLPSAFKTRPGEAYRFTLFGPIGMNPSIIRVEVLPDGSGKLELKHGKGNLYNPPAIVNAETRQLPPEQVTMLREKFHQMRFFEASAYCYNPFVFNDGPMMVYEARTTQGYHWIERLRGEHDLHDDLGLLFMALAGHPVKQLY
jgi:hypothetical protein